MKRLLLAAGVLGALVMLQSSTWAAPKAPIVTRDDFGGLALSQGSPNLMYRSYQVDKSGNFSYRVSAPWIREGLPRTGQFSDFEFNELLEAINQATLPSLDADYIWHPPNYENQLILFSLSISTDRKPPTRALNNSANEAAPDVYLQFSQALDTIFQAK